MNNREILYLFLGIFIALVLFYWWSRPKKSGFEFLVQSDLPLHFSSSGSCYHSETTNQCPAIPDGRTCKLSNGDFGTCREESTCIKMEKNCCVKNDGCGVGGEGNRCEMGDGSLGICREQGLCCTFEDKFA